LIRLTSPGGTCRVSIVANFGEVGQWLITFHDFFHVCYWPTSFLIAHSFTRKDLPPRLKENALPAPSFGGLPFGESPQTVRGEQLHVLTNDGSATVTFKLSLVKSVPSRHGTITPFSLRPAGHDHGA
jgi:hypothetical protein